MSKYAKLSLPFSFNCNLKSFYLEYAVFYQEIFWDYVSPNKIKYRNTIRVPIIKNKYSNKKKDGKKRRCRDEIE